MRRILVFLLLAIISVSVAAVVHQREPAVPRMDSTFTIDGKADARMVPGQPARLGLVFAWEGRPEPIKAYEFEHEKLMHMIVVKDDLTSFAHIHPVLDPATGRFELAVNQPSSDPDSQDAARAVRRPGRYFVFTEVKPSGQPFLYMDRFSIEAGRPDRPPFDQGGAAGPGPLTPTAPDSTAPDGLMVKYFLGDGSVGKEGAPYRVRLRVLQSRVVEKPYLTFEFFIEQARSPGVVPLTGALYEEVRDLEHWLSMAGHAIVLSTTGTTVKERIFRHMHPPMPEGSDHCKRAPDPKAPPTLAGPDVGFVMPPADIPPPGLYKIWGQFRHKGRILTFPFVVQL